MGVLDRYNVEMIGAKPAAIDMAEDRALFREAMTRIGLETLSSRPCVGLPARDPRGEVAEWPNALDC